MSEENQTPVVGRNEPCPCGSGKKYKRCCGVGAAPKLTPPKNTANPLAGMGMGEGQQPPFDPQMMMQMSQALQRLPKGQMQRLQALMAKAMQGKDISREAAEFERTLPVEFQEMMMNFKMPDMAGGAAAENATPVIAEPSEMTPEQARTIIEQARSEGKISEEQATELLNAKEDENSEEKTGGFWKSILKKK